MYYVAKLTCQGKFVAHSSTTKFAVRPNGPSNVHGSVNVVPHVYTLSKCNIFIQM